VHDGAPAHFVHNVREHCKRNTVFGQKWISCMASSILWFKSLELCYGYIWKA